MNLHKAAYTQDFFSRLLWLDEGGLKEQAHRCSYFIEVTFIIAACCGGLNYLVFCF